MKTFENNVCDQYGLCPDDGMTCWTALWQLRRDFI